LDKFSYLLVDTYDPDNPLDPNSFPIDCNTATLPSNASGSKLACRRYDQTGDPFGGNILVEGGAELIFPLPFIKDQGSVRTAFFLDMGNVYDSDCGKSQTNCYEVDLNELRYSVGVGLTWITGFGPLTFSYAIPYNDDPLDRTEEFQFSLGRSF